MVGVFEQLQQEKKFPLKPDELQDWCKCMAKRVRTMLRHIQQTRIKHPKTGWLVAGGFVTQQEVEQLSQDQADGAADPEVLTPPPSPPSAASEQEEAEEEEQEEEEQEEEEKVAPKKPQK
eukprot:5218264-Alexandrium_andersonii.AAC.1